MKVCKNSWCVHKIIQSDIGRFQAIFGLSIVDLRINETLQIGAVGNSAYQTWGTKVSIYFLNSP